MNVQRIFLAWLSLAFVVPTNASPAATLSPIYERFAPAVADSEETPDFRRHVVPLFGRLGCNGRACHGSFQGQGGFRLSMFGYDFKADHEALTKGEEPRVDIKKPAQSLILTKPTNEDEHGGGKRYDVGGWEYRVLRRWIDAGAKMPRDAAVRLTRLEVTPDELAFDDARETAELKVVAHWSDGTSEDVTCLARYSSNDDGTATVDGDGRVKSTGKGGTNIIACYDNGVVAVPVVRPVSDRVGPKYPKVPTPTKIDELVVAKLRKLGIVPAELCTDAEFLRRASVDTCGTLPTPAEIDAFLADKSPDKRRRKIDELLERPEYSIWWSTIFSDWLGMNAASELGGTDYAKPFGDQWLAWIERRLRENEGYDKIARGVVLAVSRKPGQSYEDYVAEQVSYLRVKDRVDFTAQPWMPHFWSRGNLGTPDEKGLAFAHIFLGVRLDCAQCHKHPFDQWSQQDFKDFTAFFERVDKRIHPDAAEDRKKLEERIGSDKLTTAATRRGSFLKWAAEGKPSPFYEVSILPLPKGKDGKPAKPPTLRILGGEPITLAENQDPREPVMQWMLRKDNPYFAPAFVNRIWAHYTGIGIVNPPDDFNLGNPPSNRELLKHLSDEFIAHGYDIKRLHRTIMNSRTYQQSWVPNDTNRNDDRLFSKATIRRLPAEVVADAVQLATAGAKPEPTGKTKPKKSDAPAVGFSDKSLATRFIALQAPPYERRMDYAMLVFGKPIRKVNCDCERQIDPSLLQSVYLRNDSDIATALNRADGWLKQLPAEATPDELIREAYLRVVSRPPTESETKRCLKLFANATPAEALEDVLWALLNTQEFVTNH